MQHQEPTSNTLQPLRASLNASSEQLYKLAESLHQNNDKRSTFERNPNSILQEFGLELQNPDQWIHAPAFSDLGRMSCATSDSDMEEIGPAEIAAACVVVASTVVVGAVVCAVAVAPPPPEEEGNVDGNSGPQ